ncbi:predicted protein [Lichtheimia corymbifera JMRC:FSU:9682]|uniref:Uncharacterized protein n=1 Tax=Lichtheimia corymbifera JMRC:FSU:9682 TaxID=1263082 RepID=A0A068S6W1_9FUNG|nr:predicted protein [Lichtheimia corymbifera JMRC:FSU:9682]
MNFDAAVYDLHIDDGFITKDVAVISVACSLSFHYYWRSLLLSLRYSVLFLDGSLRDSCAERLLGDTHTSYLGRQAGSEELRMRPWDCCFLLVIPILIPYVVIILSAICPFTALST